MHKCDITLTARDGYELAGTLYEPVDDSHHTVVISSATAVPRRYYERFASFLCSRGLRVITFDYRGIGDSLRNSIKNTKGTMRDWGEKDLAGVLDTAVARWPRARLQVVGHSAGGQFVGLVDGNQRICALLVVGAQSGYWRLWSRPRRYLFATLWYLLMPGLTRVMGYFPARRLGLGEDLPSGVALEWAQWCRNPAFIVDTDGSPLRTHFETLSSPILAYSIADDSLAPQRAVKVLLSYYKRASIEHRHVSPRDLGIASLGHFGFFRDKSETTLWQDSVQWLLQH
jgi:predicted alpha/beta hydrolase